MVGVKKKPITRKELCEEIDRLLKEGYADIRIHAPNCPHKECRHGLSQEFYLIEAFHKRSGATKDDARYG
jgi:hypothetical protein